LIELRSITKRYMMGGAPVEVLSSIDLDIKNGESVSIMGPSGSGKSTLMNIIGCLDKPTEGTYTLNGVRVDSMDEDALAAARNRNIGFVFQSFNLLARHTAIENVELPLFYAGVNDAELLAREALKEVGLEKRMSHRPNELSGGERQRVAIARAIVLNPPIILADEPTGNLDSRTGKEIMALFDGLHSKGTTLVLVTHDPNVAAYSQRVINIKDGRVVQAGERL
jgi:putative ABC transport system ATP-binding protein